jgi:hypothetical protein
MIVDILAAKHPALPYESISNDVVTFISRLQLRGLIKG